MSRLTALISLIIISSMVAFATYSFMQGRIEAGLSTLPFLVVLYFFIQKRPS
jgi:hypothetical protein